MTTHQYDRLDPERPGWIEAEMPRGERMLTTCAWCERVRLGDDWVSPHVAIRELRTFDWAEPPLFTHEMCPHCVDFLSAGHATRNGTRLQA